MTWSLYTVLSYTVMLLRVQLYTKLITFRDNIFIMELHILQLRYCIQFSAKQWIYHDLYLERTVCDLILIHVSKHLPYTTTKTLYCGWSLTGGWTLKFKCCYTFFYHLNLAPAVSLALLSSGVNPSTGNNPWIILWAANMWMFCNTCPPARDDDDITPQITSNTLICHNQK